jgi:hypothetical protein
LPLFKNFVSAKVNEILFYDENFLTKRQGACEKIRRKIVVEATKGYSINQGKYAKRVKSTKFERKILSTCVTTFEVFRNLRKFLKNRV